MPLNDKKNTLNPQKRPEKRPVRLSAPRLRSPVKPVTAAPKEPVVRPKLPAAQKTQVVRPKLPEPQRSAPQRSAPQRPAPQPHALVRPPDLSRYSQKNRPRRPGPPLRLRRRDTLRWSELLAGLRGPALYRATLGPLGDPAGTSGLHPPPEAPAPSDVPEGALRPPPFRRKRQVDSTISQGLRRARLRVPEMELLVTPEPVADTPLPPPSTPAPPPSSSGPLTPPPPARQEDPPGLLRRLLFEINPAAARARRDRHHEDAGPSSVDPDVLSRLTRGLPAGTPLARSVAAWRAAWSKRESPTQDIGGMFGHNSTVPPALRALLEAEQQQQLSPRPAPPSGGPPLRARSPAPNVRQRSRPPLPPRPEDPAFEPTPARPQVRPALSPRRLRDAARITPRARPTVQDPARPPRRPAHADPTPAPRGLVPPKVLVRPRLYDDERGLITQLDARATRLHAATLRRTGWGKFQAPTALTPLGRWRASVEDRLRTWMGQEPEGSLRGSVRAVRPRVAGPMVLLEDPQETQDTRELRPGPPGPPAPTVTPSVTPSPRPQAPPPPSPLRPRHTRSAARELGPELARLHAPRPALPLPPRRRVEAEGTRRITENTASTPTPTVASLRAPSSSAPSSKTPSSKTPSSKTPSSTEPNPSAQASRTSSTASTTTSSTPISSTPISSTPTSSTGPTSDPTASPTAQAETPTAPLSRSRLSGLISQLKKSDVGRTIQHYRQRQLGRGRVTVPDSVWEELDREQRRGARDETEAWEGTLARRQAPARGAMRLHQHALDAATRPRSPRPGSPMDVAFAAETTLVGVVKPTPEAPAPPEARLPPPPPLKPSPSKFGPSKSGPSKPAPPSLTPPHAANNSAEKIAPPPPPRSPLPDRPGPARMQGTSGDPRRGDPRASGRGAPPPAPPRRRSFDFMPTGLVDTNSSLHPLDPRWQLESDPETGTTRPVLPTLPEPPPEPTPRRSLVPPPPPWLARFNQEAAQGSPKPPPRASPNQTSSNQKISNQNISNQARSNQPSSNQARSDQPSSNQHGSNQASSKQGSSNQARSNQNTSNQPSSNLPARHGPSDPARAPRPTPSLAPQNKAANQGSPPNIPLDPRPRADALTTRPNAAKPDAKNPSPSNVPPARWVAPNRDDHYDDAGPPSHHRSQAWSGDLQDLPPDLRRRLIEPPPPRPPIVPSPRTPSPDRPHDTARAPTRTPPDTTTSRPPHDRPEPAPRHPPRSPQRPGPPARALHTRHDPAQPWSPDTRPNQWRAPHGADPERSGRKARYIPALSRTFGRDAERLFDPEPSPGFTPTSDPALPQDSADAKGDPEGDSGLPADQAALLHLLRGLTHRSPEASGMLREIVRSVQHILELDRMRSLT